VRVTYGRKVMNCCKWWSRCRICASVPPARLQRMMMIDSWS